MAMSRTGAQAKDNIGRVKGISIKPVITLFLRVIFCPLTPPA
jgi:hypothetical protein